MLNIFNKKLNLNKTILLNVLSTVLLQGIAFFTIPIFTRVLGSEQYGYYSIFNTWVSIVSIILPLGLSTCTSSGRYYFKNEYFSFRNNLIVYNSAITLIICLFCFLFYKPLSNIFEYRFQIFVVLFLTAFSQNIIGAITGILIYEKRAMLNFIISIFLSISNVAFSLFFIYKIPFENLYEARVYGHFIPYFLVSIFLILYMLVIKKFVLNKKYLTYGICIGLPIVFHQIAYNILSQSDKIMMEKIGTAMSEIGIYGVFVSFTGVINLILGAFNTSFGPFYADYIDADDKESMINKSKNYIELFTIICCGFILLSREVSYIMVNNQYYSGLNLIPILVLSIYFIFMYQFAVNYEFYYRRSKTIAAGTIGAAICNILLNLYLLPKYGMYGAAYSTLISYSLLFIFHYLIVINMKEKRYYVKIKYFLPYASAVIIVSIFFYLLGDFIIVRWLFGALLGLYALIKIYKKRTIF